MNHEERDAALLLAAKTLAAVRADDWEQAGAYVEELHETNGGEGIQLLLAALADTLIIHQGGPPDSNAVVVPMWVDTINGGGLELADDVPPPVRWAGRFIAARAADDEPACAALYNSITTDEEFRDNIIAMLDIVATTLDVVGAHPQ